MKSYTKSPTYGKPLTMERLRQVLRYEPESGLFFWAEGGRGRFKRPGASAGCQNGHGYVSISIDGRIYSAHRLAWAFAHGSFPRDEIDHVNGSRSDNRISNLRDVVRRVNTENQRSPRSDNKSGLLGAYWNKAQRTWVSAITVRGRQVHLGRFDSASSAHAAYLAAKRVAHEGCTL